VIKSALLNAQEIRRGNIGEKFDETRGREEIKMKIFKYRNLANVEYKMHRHTNKHWDLYNCN